MVCLRFKTAATYQGADNTTEQWQPPYVTINLTSGLQYTGVGGGGGQYSA